LLEIWQKINKYNKKTFRITNDKWFILKEKSSFRYKCNDRNQI